MTRRKPPGVSWESWTDRQIREAAERGEFENLPGKGKPLPGLEQPYDELWWVKAKLRREQLSVLPPTLAVRKEIDDARDRIEVASSEAEVRSIVAAINRRIAYVNAHAVKGPPSRVTTLDAEREVERWLRMRR